VEKSIAIQNSGKTLNENTPLFLKNLLGREAIFMLEKK